MYSSGNFGSCRCREYRRSCGFPWTELLRVCSASAWIKVQIFQVMDVPVPVMCPCRRGATSPSSQIVGKITQKGTLFPVVLSCDGMFYMVFVSVPGSPGTRSGTCSAVHVPCKSVLSGLQRGALWTCTSHVVIPCFKQPQRQQPTARRRRELRSWLRHERTTGIQETIDALRRQKTANSEVEAVFFELFDEDTAGWRPALLYLSIEGQPLQLNRILAMKYIWKKKKEEGQMDKKI